MKRGRRSRPATERVWKFVKQWADGHWSWLGGHGYRAYPYMTIRTPSGGIRPINPRRVLYEAVHGEPPPGVCIPNCEFPECMNPDHSVWGSMADARRAGWKRRDSNWIPPSERPSDRKLPHDFCRKGLHRVRDDEGTIIESAVYRKGRPGSTCRECALVYARNKMGLSPRRHGPPKPRYIPHPRSAPIPLTALAAQRYKAGLSQRDVAARLGIHPSLPAAWEIGKRPTPQRWLKPLATVLGCTIEDLAS